MTSIPRDTPLSTHLRIQLGGQGSPSTPLSARAQPTAGSPREVAASRRSVRTKSEAVDQLSLRIAQLSMDDPDRKRKAVRIYLECVMVEKWGAHLQLDPGFAQLVSRVQSQMDGDPHLTCLDQFAIMRGDAIIIKR